MKTATGLTSGTKTAGWVNLRAISVRRFLRIPALPAQCVSLPASLRATRRTARERSQGVREANRRLSAAFGSAGSSSTLRKRRWALPSRPKNVRSSNKCWARSQAASSMKSLRLRPVRRAARSINSCCARMLMVVSQTADVVETFSLGRWVDGAVATIEIQRFHVLARAETSVKRWSRTARPLAACCSAVTPPPEPGDVLT